MAPVAGLACRPTVYSVGDFSTTQTALTGFPIVRKRARNPGLASQLLVFVRMDMRGEPAEPFIDIEIGAGIGDTKQPG